MKIKKEHVSKSYNEIDRRIEIMIHDGDFSNETEIQEYRNAMLQGLYSTFMMISDNWPDVRSWCDTAERERGYYADNAE